MAAKTNKKDKNEATYKEFSYTGKTFEYTGRVWEGKEGKGKVKNNYYLSITFNNLFTINNCYLVETDDNVFIRWPQYKGKDDSYKPYVFIDKELNDEIDKLVLAIMKVLGIE